MPKRIAALAAVLVLALSGCASPEDPGSEESPSAQQSAPTPTATAPTPEPTEEVTAAPITIAPETTPAPDGAITPETAFVDAAQDFLNSWGYWDFTDEQILGAGMYACESTEVAPTVIEGLDHAYSAQIVVQARTILCP